MKNAVFVILLVLLLSGCSARKNWTATGGSRADGTVDLSYDYHIIEVPVVDMTQGIRVATERCKSWGYTDTEAFGGTRKDCIQSSYGSCDEWRVTAKYQCIGNLSTSSAPKSTVVTSKTSPEKSLYAELRQLKQLKDEGIITEAEFQSQKTQVLNAQ